MTWSEFVEESVQTTTAMPLPDWALADSNCLLLVVLPRNPGPSDSSWRPSSDSRLGRRRVRARWRSDQRLPSGPAASVRLACGQDFDPVPMPSNNRAPDRLAGGPE